MAFKEKGQRLSMLQTGKFIISLDFELNWGVRDVVSLEEYGENILGVHQAIPQMLDLFAKYNINATFSVVGFLFFKTKQEFLLHRPKVLPDYQNVKLSPYYDNFNEIGEDFIQDKYHFAPLLVAQIKAFANHEIGSHTFCHYYCLEPGQTLQSFEADLQKAIEIGKANDLEISSLIFPRNQTNADYLDVCKQNGILTYRGNERAWLYNAKNAQAESKLRRFLRLIDAYINISGQHCFNAETISKALPINIPSSRFLRPYMPALRLLESFRLKRIKSAMTFAAKNNLCYHLWWHPHNFGINQAQNFNFLDKILRHYAYLNKVYGFESITMTNLANKIIHGQ
jgi:peptidoglycan/xylan/chitin deacetylase (PgdA/CDA1 family)